LVSPIVLSSSSSTRGRTLLSKEMHASSGLEVTVSQMGKAPQGFCQNAEEGLLVF
jgi:hypothetical protein